MTYIFGSGWSLLSTSTAISGISKLRPCSRTKPRTVVGQGTQAQFMPTQRPEFVNIVLLARARKSTVEIRSGSVGMINTDHTANIVRLSATPSDRCLGGIKTYPSSWYLIFGIDSPPLKVIVSFRTCQPYLTSSVL